MVGERVCQLDSEAAVQATQLIYDLIYTYKVSPMGTTTYTEGEVRKLYEVGGAVMAREWMDMATEFNNPEVSQVAGTVGTALLPAGPAGSHSCVGGWVYAINKFTEHPKEAYVALKFLTSVEVLKIGLFTDGITPPRPDVYDDPELKTNPVWAELGPLFVKAGETGIPRPVSPIWPQQSDVISRAIHKVFVGEMTAQEAMQWAAQEVQQIEDAYVGS